MDLEMLSKELKEQRQLLESIYVSAEKTRKYFLWTTIVTVVIFVLPLIALAMAIPSFLGIYSDLLNVTELGL